jgi:hypothetical protein
MSSVSPGHYQHAEARLRAGTAAAEVEAGLITRGATPAAAAQIVAELQGDAGRAARAQAAHPGRADMITGAAVGGVGLAVTLFSYTAASANGGSYVVAWGAIAVGVWRFGRGVMKQR